MVDIKNKIEVFKKLYLRFKYPILVIVSLLILFLSFVVINNLIENKAEKDMEKEKQIYVNSQYEDNTQDQENKKKESFLPCPSDISGILTYPLVDPKYIQAIKPLGDVNPPGHTSPVDHASFMTDYTGLIPIYAPSDGVITKIESFLELQNGEYVVKVYSINFTICNGLELDLAAMKDTPLNKDFNVETDCRYNIKKVGETNTYGSCGKSLKLPIKAGEIVGYTQIDSRRIIDFEFWATNYNMQPREDVNWEYYDDERYEHAICLFDLYSGELKKQFSNFGRYDSNSNPQLILRTKEPLCGEINQDKTGSIQGMWFNGSPKESSDGIAFIHDYVQADLGQISIGMGLTEETDIVNFVPISTGKINRDPADVTADGNIYCYDLSKATNRTQLDGKILVQLVDEHHIKVEYKEGKCISSEIFVNPFNYQR